jgi:hypothetical protein
MFKLLIASLTVWLVCGPCSADNFKPIIKESDCGGDDEWPVWTLPTPVNETWLTTMKERIGNAFYRTVEGEQIKTRLECTFLLDDQGNVQDLFVWSSYSSKGTNEEALKAIRTCGPYKNPPDALLRLIICFHKFICNV